MTALQLVGLVFAAMAAIVHVTFFVLESVLFSLPAGRRVFGVRAENDSAPLRLFAINQGVYNLALAIVVVVGIVLVTIDPVALTGTAVIVAGCSVMTVAGAALALTAPRRTMPIALTQGIPPLIAIVAVLAAH